MTSYNIIIIIIVFVTIKYIKMNNSITNIVLYD